MSYKLLITVDWIVVAQFLLLAIILLLLYFKNKFVSNAFLSLYCFLLVAMNTLLIVYGQGQLPEHPYLLLPIKIVPVLLPVIFFLYLESILNFQWKWNKIYSYAFLPSLLVAIYYVYIVLQPEEVFMDFIKNYQNRTGSFAYKMVAIVALGEFMLVLVVQGNKIRKYISKTRMINSETKFLKWIYGWVITSIVFGVLTSLYPALFSDSSKSMLWIPVSMVPFLFTIIYSSFIYPDIYNDIKVISGWNNDPKNRNRKPENLRELFNKIDAHVTSQKSFLREDITVHNLAVELDMAPHIISLTINGFLGKNFNSYINSQRVKEARTRLASDAHKNFTIEAIGKSVGFRSKSAFYTAFKKETGHTPQHFFSPDIQNQDTERS